MHDTYTQCMETVFTHRRKDTHTFKHMQTQLYPTMLSPTPCKRTAAQSLHLIPSHTDQFMKQMNLCGDTPSTNENEASVNTAGERREENRGEEREKGEEGEGCIAEFAIVVSLYYLFCFIIRCF